MSTPTMKTIRVYGSNVSDDLVYEYARRANYWYAAWKWTAGALMVVVVALLVEVAWMYL